MQYILNFSLLKRNRNYALLFAGQSISFLGTMITGVALPYQIYHATKSIFMVGLLSLVQLLPLLVTALIGGVFADRYHRRMLLLVSEAVLAIGSLTLTLNALSAHPYIWLIFVTSAVMSAFNGLHRPALESIGQQIVAKKDFPTMGSLSSLRVSIGMIIGPAIGGVLIANYGIPITYFIDFLSFLICFITILLMSNVPRPAYNRDISPWKSLLQGLRYAWSRQELLGTYFVDFIAMVFGWPNALFPAIAEHFGGPKILGMLYAAPAVGALFISFFSGWTASVKRHGAAIAISAAFWGMAIIFFGLSSKLWMALIFLAFAGALDTINAMFRMIMWNETIPQELRGRMAGIEMISYLSGPKLGDTEAGVVASLFGISFAIVSGGTMCIVGVTIVCYLLPKFWRYRSDIS